MIPSIKVSIGIPTYNRAKLLKRAIDSALSQKYSNIEVIVSDNASTDNTIEVCQSYSTDKRFKLISQTQNRGSSHNFMAVLGCASGEFFMWLGDDDWIDENYISICMEYLISNPSFVLVGGKPQYYQNGKHYYEGKQFDLTQNYPWIRIAKYYANVSDNGMFYGVIRKNQVGEITLPNTMGGDWHMIASMISHGKSKMFTNTSVHRELGGATTSYKQIVKSMGLPQIQGVFPQFFIALGALKFFLKKGNGFLAILVFCIVVCRGLIENLRMVKNKVLKK